MPLHVRLIICTVFFAANTLAAPPIIHSDFEKNESGWITFGAESAHVHVTRDPAQVKNGKGALMVEYEASATKPAAAILPISQSLAAMKSIRLWLMADSPTAAAVTLSEKQGGRYAAILWLVPQVWQRVELTTEDFILAQGPGDPKDPDGKLDLDQIEGIGVIDLSQILNPGLAAKNPGRVAVVTHTGAHKLFIDDFEVSEELPGWFQPRKAYEMETFNHPQLDWFTLGGPDLKLDTSKKVIAGNALQASYEQMEDAFVLLIHALPPMDLSGATDLSFDIAAEQDAHIIFVFEQQAPRSGRYNAVIEVKGGGKSEHRDLPLSAFQVDKESDGNAVGPLDVNNLRSMSILDITGAFTKETAMNTIWLGNIGMVKKALQ